MAFRLDLLGGSFHCVGYRNLVLRLTQWRAPLCRHEVNFVLSYTLDASTV